MRGAAAVLAVKLGIFDKFLYPFKIFPDDNPAQMVFIVAILSSATVMDIFLTHKKPPLRSC
jgi:hypothetical protein